MIPEIGKTYKIDYWHQVEPGEDTSDFYKGNAKCVEIPKDETDTNENPVYFFEIGDTKEHCAFAEEDIIEEIKS
jgi:hypothetical protein